MFIWKFVFLISMWTASIVTSTSEESSIPNSSSASIPDATLDNNVFKIVYSCELNALYLDCVQGEVIHIIRANYGRLTRQFFNETGQVMWSGERCMSDISYSILSDRCERKKTCSVQISSTLFGGTCNGTITYLDVQYVCISPSNATSTAEHSSLLNNFSTPELGAVPDTTLANKLSKTVYSCKANVLHIGCMKGSFIHMIHSNYGRLTRDLYNETDRVMLSEEHCTAIKSSIIMAKRCEQRQECSVKASNALFGNTCHGKIKYIEAQYVCVSPSTVSSTTEQSVMPNTSSASERDTVPDTTLDSSLFKTVYSCEHDVLHLRCVEGSVIHIIRAVYGRLTKDICNEDGQVMWSGKPCTSIKSSITVAKRCEQKERCSVRASNELFGDPCYGTIKYLDVQYVCVSPSNVSSTTEQSSILNSSSASELDSKPDTTLDSKHFKTQYSCEHSDLHLGCVEGSVIHIIRANYGRLNRDLCNADRKVVWSGERCASIRSSNILSNKCEQKQSCSVPASNALFGDPCYGTIKYLEVEYVCVSPSNVSNATEQSSSLNTSSASELDSKPDTTLDSKHLKTQYSCENSDLHLGCMEGNVIHIIRANYGRLNRDLCNADQKVVWSGERCASDRSSSILANKCEQKKSCNVPASNTIFGDPCYGTIKYLEVQYVCVSPSHISGAADQSSSLNSSSTSEIDSKHTATLDKKLSKIQYSCEHSNLHIDCMEGSVIHITRANYGRLNRDLCNADRKVVWSGKRCGSDRSSSILSNRCEQEQSCSVPASNALFGDPCYGTIKYLEVEYVCVSPSNVSSATEQSSSLNSSSASVLDSKPDTTLDSKHLKTQYSCENSDLHIDCMEGSVIRIIRANYGRLNRDLCNADRKVVWSEQRCMSDRSSSILANECERKERCSVRASNELFGDPCYGTIKYLEVQYVCVPKSIYNTTEKSSIRHVSFASKLGSKQNITLDSKLLKTQYACENNVLHLSCVEGDVIHISQASYGRSTRDLCNKDGKVMWSGKLCTSMRSSTIVIANRCEQKQSCSVRASNTLFGDPCYGTIKYLEVQYACISR